MATYKQPCIHCGAWLDPAERFCPTCGSNSPRGYACPHCLKDIRKDWRVCPGCGRALYIPCPACHQFTFVDDRCAVCGQPLMVRCANQRCGVAQFFENEKCTACGHKITAQLAIQPMKERLQ